MRAAVAAVVALIALLGASTSRAVVGTTFTVTTPNDSGAGSLRQAILDANATKAADTIQFSVGAGAQTISLATPLPRLVYPLTIDGTTQPGYSGSPLITIDGTSNSFPCVQIDDTGDGTTLDALVLKRCSTGVYSTAKKGHVTVSGSTVRQMNYGLYFSNSPSNVVTGCLIAANVLDGVRFQGPKATGNEVLNSKIGTNAAGTAADANGRGIYSDGSRTMIQFDLVSGNTGDGIDLDAPGSGSFVGDTGIGIVQGGAAALGNGGVGLSTAQAKTNIGENQVAGNGGDGIALTGDQDYVYLNSVGVAAGGGSALANGGNGIVVGGMKNLIRQNLISGNTLDGIHVTAAGTTIQANLVGTNPFTSAAVANGDDGIEVQGTALVGGPKSGDRNIVSGNTTAGIRLVGDGSRVFGNLVGTNGNGTAALANGTTGLIVVGSGNVIGGVKPPMRNTFSGNAVDGVRILGDQNVVHGNYIGAASGAVGGIPNGSDGVRIVSGNGNLIGGTKLLLGNVIAYNTARGIEILGGTGNRLEGGYLFSNGMLGIDLDGDGVTANDGGDADTGTNDLQNFPVLASAPTAAGVTTVTGSLHSHASRSYRVEFFANTACDGSGNGEGYYPLGAKILKTDSAGNLSFVLTFKNPGGATITATAMDMTDGSTSEFSNCAS